MPVIVQGTIFDRENLHLTPVEFILTGGMHSLDLGKESSRIIAGLMLLNGKVVYSFPSEALPEIQIQGDGEIIIESVGVFAGKKLTFKNIRNPEIQISLSRIEAR